MLGLKKIGGETVGKGNYWNISTGERVHMDSAGILPGDEKAHYYKLPPLVMLLTAPIIGLLYAVFLPFIGIAMLIVVAGRRLFGGSAALRKGATFSWKPSEAYLAGKKKKNSTEKTEKKE
ncbi:MAG: hypothetical protein HY805_05800 [Nitrospirae bacterium]|nr:hypothetical protein [Nitrospirota bacterium]